MKNRKSPAAFVLIINTIATNNMGLTAGPKNAANFSPSPQQQNFNQNSNEPMVMSDGEWNLTPNVPAMTQTITNTAGSGGAAVVAYFLNEADYNTTATNNGSGANSVVKTYGDGWSGKGYNNLAKLYAAQNGIKCYGFTLIFTAAGVQDAAGITLANPTWLMVNLVGANTVPKGFVLGAGVRNTQYLQGTMTMKGIFYLGPLNQISYSVPIGDVSTFTVLTTPF